ncbi:ferritin-like protein [Thalassomonas sp. RHCl1]|uniref:ferritin-like domain-containing protein n=1 Tax=Thalassomonas sp. RHCl1 TaxID=2995320 RepID=UPI00248D16C9|nr:ferritin-like protein [Thalassomonas sp. RHCl1]
MYLSADKQKRFTPITSISELHQQLQLAIELEFSTLPPYLSALYSIKENTNNCAYQVIQSVVMEEMFHLTNAANVLIATGGSPALNNTDFIPSFPTRLPDGEQWFEVSLLKFSPEALQTFKYIEEPSENVPGKITIGDFYANVEKGLTYLSETLPPDELFPANTGPQIAHKYYYGGGGEITPVTDLDSAMFAINAIIAQGEGIPDRCWDPDKPFPLEEGTGIASGDHQLFMQPRELAHYYRFNELACGRRYVCGDSHNSGPTGPKIPIDYAQVYNMKPNPNSGDYAFAPELAALDYEFNRIFTLLLDQLHNAFNGDPELLVPAVGTMFKLKELAQELMRNPIPDSPEQYNAGPTWQYLKS